MPTKGKHACLTNHLLDAKLRLTYCNLNGCFMTPNSSRNCHSEPPVFRRGKETVHSFLRIFVLKLFSCNEPSAFHCCPPTNNKWCCLKLFSNTQSVSMP